MTHHVPAELQNYVRQSIMAQFENLGELVKNTIFVA